MKDIKSMTLAELGTELKALGEPAFRAKQIYRWMHRGVRDFSEMTDISRSLRERLTAEYTLVSPTVARRLQSQKDGTIKYLWRLMDGNCVESVLMRYHYGNTICISSEVGCRMGCAFCASTRGGLVRRLEPSEMLDQVLFSQLDSGLPISHIVLMGIGEPLDNYDNVRRFLELVNSPEGLRGGEFLTAALPYLAGGALGGIAAGLLLRRLSAVWLHRALGALIVWGGLRLLLR